MTSFGRESSPIATNSGLPVPADNLPDASKKKPDNRVFVPASAAVLEKVLRFLTLFLNYSVQAGEGSKVMIGSSAEDPASLRVAFSKKERDLALFLLSRLLADGSVQIARRGLRPLHLVKGSRGEITIQSEGFNKIEDQHIPPTAIIDPAVMAAIAQYELGSLFSDQLYDVDQNLVRRMRDGEIVSLGILRDNTTFFHRRLGFLNQNGVKLGPDDVKHVVLRPELARLIYDSCSVEMRKLYSELFQKCADSQSDPADQAQKLVKVGSHSAERQLIKSDIDDDLPVVVGSGPGSRRVCFSRSSGLLEIPTEKSPNLLRKLGSLYSGLSVGVVYRHLLFPIDESSGQHQRVNNSPIWCIPLGNTVGYFNLDHKLYPTLKKLIAGKVGYWHDKESQKILLISHSENNGLQVEEQSAGTNADSLHPLITISSQTDRSAGEVAQKHNHQYFLLDAELLAAYYKELEPTISLDGKRKTKPEKSPQSRREKRQNSREAGRKQRATKKHDAKKL